MPGQATTVLQSVLFLRAPTHALEDEIEIEGARRSKPSIDQCINDYTRVD